MSLDDNALVQYPLDHPVIDYLLRQRQDHARSLKEDYSHVFRKKTIFEIVKLSALAMAIEFAYAAETSLIGPVLLEFGVNYQHMSMVWCLSPFIGLLCSPILGSWSDRCHLRWGRRKPFITLLSIGVILGLLLVSNSKQLARNWYAFQFDDKTISSDALETENEMQLAISTINLYAAIFTILGTFLVDFNADNCLTPARTYLLEMCVSQDQSRALSTFTLLAGFGGTLGYIIAAIDWSATGFKNIFGSNVSFIFNMVAIIYWICLLTTIFNLREIPLSLIEKDDLLKPITEIDIRNEIAKNKPRVYYIQMESYKPLQPEVFLNSMEVYSTLALQSIEENTKNDSSKKHDHKTKKFSSFYCYLRSIFIMPKSLKILAVTHLISWMSHVTFSLYFTDFVGEVIFEGDPRADINTESALNYDSGVRFGCWCLAIYSISCSFYSLMVERIIQKFGVKCVYIGGLLYYSLGMLILALWPNRLNALVLSTSAGISYGTIYTIPYIIVAQYHQNDIFYNKDGSKQSRGLATDMSIINSMSFIGQIIVSLWTGFLVNWLQTTTTILYFASFLSCIAIVSAMFVEYLQENCIKKLTF